MEPAAGTLEHEVVEVIKTCYDPEIPVDIWELGLIYGVEAAPDGRVTVRMTLTSPACPVAESLPLEVESKIRALPAVTDVRIELVWEPPWDKDLMSDVAKLRLGFF